MSGKANKSPETVDTETTMLDALWTEVQVAAFLGISIKTMAPWRNRGRGPRFIKVGHLVRYRPADVRAYVEQQARTSTSDDSVRAA